MGARKGVAPAPKATREGTKAAMKASQGWQMRVMGHTWQTIAETIGWHDAATAYRAVHNYFGKVPKPEHDMMRQIARERTEYLQKKALEQVELSPTPANIRAAVEVLRRAAALDGLDAAMKIAIEATDREVKDFVEMVVLMSGQTMPDEADPFGGEADIFETEMHEIESSASGAMSGDTAGAATEPRV